MNKLIGILVLALAACGGKGGSDETMPKETVPTAAAGALTITELAFYEGDDLGLKVHADGTIEVKGMHSENGQPAVEEWKAVGQLTADGKVVHDGQEAGQLQPDGSFKMTDGTVAPFHIDGDALVAGDNRVTIDDKGMISGANPGSKPIRVEGVTDAGSRRAALLVLGLMVSGGPVESHVESSHVETVPPAVTPGTP